jgi:sirohydrochlorin ferrochelatase
MPPAGFVPCHVLAPPIAAGAAAAPHDDAAARTGPPADRRDILAIFRIIPYDEAMVIVTRPQPPTHALLVVSHGDGGTDPRDLGPRRLAERLGERLSIPVAAAMLRRPATLEAARAVLTGPYGPWPAAERTLVVYPFFMTEGWFVREKLPRALSDAGFSDWIRLRPFGTDPDLVAFLDLKLGGIAARAGIAPAALKAVLVAHGSASGEAGSRLTTQAIRDELIRRGWAGVSIGFIEEEPFYDTVIAEARPDAVIGLFVTSGTHAVNDVAGAVARAPSVREHVVAVGLEGHLALDMAMHHLTVTLGAEIAPFVVTAES